MQPTCAKDTTMDRHTETPDISRRTFLTTTSAVLVGATLGGLAPQSRRRSATRNGAVCCNLARVSTLPVSIHTAIINCIPATRRRSCIPA